MGQCSEHQPWQLIVPLTWWVGHKHGISCTMDGDSVQGRATEKRTEEAHGVNRFGGGQKECPKSFFLFAAGNKLTLHFCAPCPTLFRFIGVLDTTSVEHFNPTRAPQLQWHKSAN